MKEKELEELEREYERLLRLLDIEMIEGVGLEGDWDLMADQQKAEAFARAIADCEQRLEDLKQELELRDAFGKPYTVHAFSKKIIVKILDNLDVEEIVREAYRCYCPRCANGVAQLCIEDGKLTCGTYTTGSGDIQGMHYIDLYSIDQNLDLSTEDILDEDERKKYYDIRGSLEEFCEREGIDYQEREIEALTQYAYDYIGTEDWRREIEEHLDEIYGGEEEEEEE